MSDKSVIRRQLHQLKRVKTWQLVVVFILLLLLSMTFLRLNSIGMVERRDAVIAADKSGDIYAIQNRIYDLHRYSSSRMNASSGPVYLTEQYKRDTQELVEQRRRADGGGTIFSKADSICKSRFVGNSLAYVQCVANEIESMPNAVDASEDISLPNPALYRYNFASPGWSADFAGFSVLATFLVGLLIAIRLTAVGILRLLVKRQYRSI